MVPQDAPDLPRPGADQSAEVAVRRYPTGWDELNGDQNSFDQPFVHDHIMAGAHSPALPAQHSNPLDPNPCF